MKKNNEVNKFELVDCGSFWLDPKSRNTWDKQKYNFHEARIAAASMAFCVHCHNCSYCDNCQYCDDCHYCHACNHSSSIDYCVDVSFSKCCHRSSNVSFDSCVYDKHN